LVVRTNGTSFVGPNNQQNISMISDKRANLTTMMGRSHFLEKSELELDKTLVERYLMKKEEIDEKVVDEIEDLYELTMKERVLLEARGTQ
jgi:hypothetical protein